MNFVKHVVWVMAGLAMAGLAQAADEACTRALNLAPVSIKLLSAAQVQVERGAIPLVGLLRQTAGNLPEGAVLQSLKVESAVVRLQLTTVTAAMAAQLSSDLAQSLGFRPRAEVTTETNVLLQASYADLASAFACPAATARAVHLRSAEDQFDALYQRAVKRDLSISLFRPKAVMKASSFKQISQYPVEFEASGSLAELVNWLDGEARQSYAAAIHQFELTRLKDGQYQTRFEYRLAGEPVLLLAPR
ncbi:hypothetical protein [Chitinivorax sp. B]|uniref:hypothetical protein n=1 Tax=Chitinivorax sp. B TaxID=2502235 RepID=UPI0010F8BA51|nr:hypothetical protein [Chitinivorax sp. B]